MTPVTDKECEILAELMALGQGELERKGESLEQLIVNNGMMCFFLGRRETPTAEEVHALKNKITLAARDLYMQAREAAIKESYSLLDIAKKYQAEMPAQSVVVKPRRSRYLETGMMPEKEYIAAGFNQEFDDGPITADEKSRMNKI
jgi:hypothetical protein